MTGGVFRIQPDSLCWSCNGKGTREICAPDHWKGNDRHMLIAHNGGCTPTHDPPEAGCESCGYLDDAGVTATDLAWAESPAWSPDRGQWLCMECH